MNDSVTNFYSRNESVDVIPYAIAPIEMPEIKVTKTWYEFGLKTAKTSLCFSPKLTHALAILLMSWPKSWYVSENGDFESFSIWKDYILNYHLNSQLKRITISWSLCLSIACNNNLCTETSGIWIDGNGDSINFNSVDIFINKINFYYNLLF